MSLNLRFIWTLACIVSGIGIYAQPQNNVEFKVVKKEYRTLPGKVINIPCFIENKGKVKCNVEVIVNLPDGWKLLTQTPVLEIEAENKRFMPITVLIPPRSTVNVYDVTISARNLTRNENIGTDGISVKVDEIENIEFQVVNSPEHIYAGDTYEASYLVKNAGNTIKNIFFETYNCFVEGGSSIKLEPGKSATIKIIKETSEDIVQSRKEIMNVKAVSGGEVIETLFRSVHIFPVKEAKTDLFFRYPIQASFSYLATNQRDYFESAYQFEIYGNGTLDVAGNHKLEFLARGPNISNMSHLGVYDQYFISYEGKNIEFAVGERTFQFTPLTESSRFGFGVENKVKLNNALSAGFLYVKPQFFEEISNEMALYTSYEKDISNKLELFFVQKDLKGVSDPTYLLSLNTAFQPFESTNMELEVSRGFYDDRADNAFRGSINSGFSIFHVGGTYYHTGKNYPGYYSNSKFYSGNLSAQISEKLSVGYYAREDFSNAQLDTFFVTAPYTKSSQYFLNYNLGRRSYLKFYWRENERKDRLSLEKFHYETKSFNAQFRQKFNQFNYSIRGEYGKTRNYLSEIVSKQNTYLVSLNLGYRFNENHSIRTFGTYSNINRFVSEDDNYLTAGISANSRFFDKLKASFYLQNAYDIDDYYKNRNLMQFHLTYDFLPNHSLALRSYYTLFRRSTEDPEFVLSATYQYKLGVPLKQVVEAGDFVGHIYADNGAPLEGIMLRFSNKTTISDQNGEFKFKSIPPGVYLLDVDRKKLSLNEIPNIPLPIRVEIIANEEAILNFRIVKGAKLSGKIVEGDTGIASGEEETRLGNIVLELAQGESKYHVSTSEDGEFSFPIVLPGDYDLKVFEKTLPKKHELDKATTHLYLKPGDDIDYPIELKKQKRKVIFKSQNIALSSKGKSILSGIRPAPKVKKSNSSKEDQVYYSVQVGAFVNKLDKESSFFGGYKFDFERQVNNLHKYFIGQHKTREEAEEAMKKLQKRFRGAFVVVFKQNKLIYINE